ncbi:MAG TPA: HxsD-like protein [Myxococcota bacterium]|nr:HxsD-like protein [Myxococcota bacterium]
MPDLRFHRSLYPAEVVVSAAETFSQLATITVEDNEHDVKLSIEDVHPHFEGRLADELANYVLQATIQAERS